MSNGPIEESLSAMDEVVRAGKVRQPAISNYAAWQACEILWIQILFDSRPISGYTLRNWLQSKEKSR